MPRVKAARPTVLQDSPASSLPPLYARWIAEVLDGPLPEEHHATCLDCAMCKPTGAAATASVTQFNPKVKCCTYVPMLWNFLVGRILSDDTPEAAPGRKTVQQRIAQGVGVTPLGLQPSTTHELIYRYGPELFGRSEALLCPHYLPENGGLCGIWRNRNAACATWFCKFERGAKGRAFWGALLHFLVIVERHLALWCATTLGQPEEMLGPALVMYYGIIRPATNGEGRRSGYPSIDAQQDSAWHPRSAGRAADFYIEASRLVDALSWNQVAEIAGPDVVLQCRLLRQAYASLNSAEIPERLRLGAIGTLAYDGETTAVSGYSMKDMLILPTAVVRALTRFDGDHATSELLCEMAAEGTPLIDASLLRRLVDFEVLAEMPQVTSPTSSRTTDSRET